jgi:hypothetical protein
VQRLVDAAPCGNRHYTTLVAGLRMTGVTAPMMLNGVMTGAAFQTWVMHCLVPTREFGYLPGESRLVMTAV